MEILSLCFHTWVHGNTTLCVGIVGIHPRLYEYTFVCWYRWLSIVQYTSTIIQILLLSVLVSVLYIPAYPPLLCSDATTSPIEARVSQAGSLCHASSPSTKTRNWKKVLPLRWLGGCTSSAMMSLTFAPLVIRSATGGFPASLPLHTLLNLVSLFLGILATVALPFLWSS